MSVRPQAQFQPRLSSPEDLCGVQPGLWNLSLGAVGQLDQVHPADPRLVSEGADGTDSLGVPPRLVQDPDFVPPGEPRQRKLRKVLSDHCLSVPRCARRGRSEMPKSAAQCRRAHPSGSGWAVPRNRVFKVWARLVPIFGDDPCQEAGDGGSADCRDCPRLLQPRNRPYLGFAVSFGEPIRPRREVIRAAVCRSVLGSPREQSSAGKPRAGPEAGSIPGVGRNRSAVSRVRFADLWSPLTPP